MIDNTYPFIKRSKEHYPEQEPRDRTKTLQINRIYPIDGYEIPPEILNHATRYHFLRVPLMGQFNPVARVDNWCGRTSASMLWNYHQLAAGHIKSKNDYISHWRGSAGTGQMNLRYPTGDVAFLHPDGRYALLGPLQKDLPVQDFPGSILGAELSSRERRLREAEQIRSSLEEQRKHFSRILKALENNNPAILYTGMSTSYGGHIVLICGFCEMPDSDGSTKLWLLIADPSPPKLHQGPMCTPVGRGDDNDYQHLSMLQTGKNELVSIIKGEWTWGRGFLYLLRASKLLEQNTAMPAEGLLWLDDPYNKRLGGYVVCKTTPTPLDPRLVLTKNVTNNLAFPFQAQPHFLQNPIRQYRSTETSSSGYFPLGANQALHGGVHLPSSSRGPSQVRSAAPGYIVAARLPKKGAPKPTLDFLSNETGFVLVRHDWVGLARETPDKSNGAASSGPATLPFYSLNMHFMPTRWPENLDDPYMDIPWLRRFYMTRHGAVVNLDANTGPIGQLLWAAEGVVGGAAECGVYTSPTDIRRTQQWMLRKDQQYKGYFKSPQGDLVQAYEALDAGSVVTFSGPLLPVEHGEALGLVRPQAAQPSGDQGDKPSGWLHWEILAPADKDNAIQEVWNLASSKLKVRLSEVSETGAGKQDNLLEHDELETLLQDKLPTDSDKQLAGYLLSAIKQKNYEGFHKAMSSFMGKMACFVNQRTPGELVAPIPATQGPGAGPQPQGQQALAPERYIITLQIDNKQYRVTPSNERPPPYTVALQYFTTSSPEQRGRALASASLQLTAEHLQQDTLQFHLQVPIEADALELDCPQFHLDVGSSEGEVDTSLAQAFMAARWRGVRIQHNSEWSPAALEKLVPKLHAQNMLDTSTTVKDVMPTAWYGVPRTRLDSQSPVEVPILGPKGQELSLFDESAGMLPVKNGSAGVLNAHPVTFLWLLKLLQKANLGTLATEFKLDASEPGGEVPVFWGFIAHDDTPHKLGKPLSVVAIRRDWGAGPVTLVARRLDPAAPGSPRTIQVARGEYRDGVFSAPYAPCFWGHWELEVQGHEQARPQLQGGLEPPLSLQLPEPKLARTFEPVKDGKTGLYSAELHFTENCPESFGGYLTYQFTKVSLPPRREWPEAESWLLDAETGGYIQGLKKGARNVTAHFALSDFLGVSQGHGGVSVDLCMAAERLRRACKVHLRVVELSSDGRTALLEARPPARLEALRLCASQQAQAFNTSIEVTEVASGRKKAFRIQLTAGSIPLPLDWQEATCCTPLYARRVQPTEGQFLLEGEFLKGLKSNQRKDAKVSAHFRWSQYARAAGRSSFKVSKHLAAQVEALCSRARLRLSLEALSEDGLTVGIRCAGWRKSKDRLQSLAEALTFRQEGEEVAAFARVELRRLPLSGPESLEEPEVLVLAVHAAPEDTSGWLRFEFDPRDVFGALLRQARPAVPDERVWLRAAFTSPNGYEVEHYEGPPRIPGQTPQDSASAESLRAEVEGVFKTLAWPGFEPMRVSIQGRELIIRIPLRGRRVDWTNAGPVISVDGKPFPVKPGGAGLVIAVPLVARTQGELAYGNRERLNLQAFITRYDALFDGERIAIDPVSLELSTVLQLLGPLSVEELPGKIKLSAPVYCCPTNASSLRLLYRVTSEQALARARKTRRALQGYVTRARVRYTGEGLQGVFEAEYAVRPGESYHFELAPGAKDGKLLGARVQPLVLDYTAPAGSH